MSIPSWPVTLPQEILAGGYNEAPPDTLLRSPMETGPAKVRRRSTAAVRPVAGEIIVTPAELEIFKGFYNDDLLGGSLRFSWVDPIDGTTANEMRFKEVPAWSPDGGFYRISMNLEILP